MNDKPTTIKETTIMLLLTTTKTYLEIVAEIMVVHPDSKSTVKCVAFYAHQLKKIDKTCLSHRQTSRSKENNLANLIAKYGSAPTASAEAVGEKLDEAMADAIVAVEDLAETPAAA